MEKHPAEVKEKVYQIIAEELSIQEKIIIDDDVLLIEDLGFDSIQLMNLIVQLENRFEIDFTDSDLLFESYNQIGDLCSLVCNLIQNKEKGI